MKKQKKPLQLKTKRLLLTAMTEAELAEKAAAERDGHMKNAYLEMLDGVRREPELANFYTEWRITLRADGTEIGGAGFKGGQKELIVEIGYGVEPAHRGQGYAAEAVAALCEWAFSQQDVYYVQAETEPGNAASARVLEKCGFVPAGTGAEGPRYEKEKPASCWMSIYLCLGVSVGLSFGTALDNLALGMCIGMAVGVALGVSLDAQDRKTRKKFRGGGDGK